MRALPRRLLLATLVVGVATSPVPAPAETRPEDVDRQTPHVLPTEMCRSFFLVTVTLSGPPGRELLLILDTGAATTILDPDSVLRVAGKKADDGSRVRLRDASAGPLRLERLSARARELDHISLALGRPIDGILGYDAFEDLLLTLDYPEREVRVGRGRLRRPNGKDVFKLRGRGRPFFELQIGERREIVLLDSGSSSSFVMRPSPSWVWLQAPGPVGARAKINGIIVRSAARLAGDIRFGPAVAARPIIELTDGTQLVGSALLRHFELTFEGTRRVRIRQVQPAPIELATPRGIGVGFHPRPEGLEIIQVFEGSPAAAVGVLVGDLVTAIDGMPVADRGCKPAIPEDRPQVTLSIVREDEALSIEVPVESLLPTADSPAESL